MPGFLKSVFGKSPTATESVGSASKEPQELAYERLEAMSFLEILDVTKSLPPNVSLRSGTAIARRLYNIGLYDNHVPQEHRDAALKLVEGLTRDLEAACADNPQSLAALNAAATYMKENVRLRGVGSLAWKLDEFSISGGETIPYIMKPEHRHLVPDFLEISGESVAKAKPHLLRELIVQSDYRSRNAVLILHGLTAQGDKAVAALLSPEEHDALLNVPEKYDAGRAVLVSYGLLPTKSAIGPFASTPDTVKIASEIIREKAESADDVAYVADLSEASREALLLGLTFLRVELARAQLLDIYGPETAAEFRSIFRDQVAQELERYDKAIQILKIANSPVPLDFMLLDAVMAIGGIEAKSEEEWERNRDFMNLATHRLNSERVEFLDYMRCMMRAFTNVTSKKSVDWTQLATVAEDRIGV